ncbi:MAG: hypothetical protein H7Y33_07260 [Cytophagales bacterium]|nr:hypothetical protein [Rhizobacter sp.]
MNIDVIKPLMSNGLQYVKEVLKCSLAGLVVSGTVLLVLIGVLPSRPGPMATAAMGFVFFLIFYGLVGHQRGILRMLSNLSHSHGGLLFDQTLGRFMQMTESRRPGSLAGMLSAPGKLTASFKEFLRNDGSIVPRPLRRLGIYYVGKFDARITQSGALPVGAVVDGQLHEEALKDWAVQQMREQFEPSWTGFLTLAGTQIVLAGALWWFTR